MKRDNFDPWLDEEDLLPGQDWDLEITNAVRNSDVVVVRLSNGSVSKTGYVQKEIKHALDAADHRPEGTIFIIPVKLEECKVPDRLGRWHWVDLFTGSGYQKLLKALDARASHVGALCSSVPVASPESDKGGAAVFPPTVRLEYQLDIVINYERLLISQSLHRYRLEVVVKNIGMREVDNYWIELSFPKSVIDESGIIMGELKERQTDTHRFFRITSKELKKTLYPGDSVEIMPIQYRMDDQLYWSKVLSSPVRVTAQIPGYAPFVLEKRFEDIQIY